MALFPASPVNGQTTVVNGITYTYSSSQTAWIRTGSGFTSDFAVGGNGTFGGNVTANGFIGNLELINTTWNQGTGVLQVVGNAGINGNAVGTQFYNAGGNNLLPYSAQFDNAAWVKNNTSVTANSIVAPDGTTTADKLVENTATSTHEMLRAITQAATSDYTLSMYAKAGGRTSLLLSEAFSFGGSATFDLANGTVTTVAPAKNGTITPVGNGWYRLSLTWTFTASTYALLYLYLLNNGNSLYTGDGVSGIYLWGAQIEAGPVASTYTPTTSSIVTTLNRTFVGSGTAALPGLTFNQDGTTGLWLPTASTLALSTAGSERVRVDSSGNVGIGTSSPSYILDVSNGGVSGAKLFRFIGAASKSLFGFSDSSGSGISNSDPFTNGALVYLSGKTMQFWNGSLLALILDASGNLGLGVAPSPWGSPVASVLEFPNGNSLYGNGTVSVFQMGANFYYDSAFRYKANGFASRYRQDGGQHIWYTASSGTAGNSISWTQAMLLDGSSNLGLGVTPSAWTGNTKALQIKNTAIWGDDYAGKISVGYNVYQDTDTTYKYISSIAAGRYDIVQNIHRWFIAPSGTAGNAISFTQAMTLDASGNLGIGTTSPAQKLDVNGNANVSGTTTSSGFITNSTNIITDATTTRTLSATDNGKTIYFTSSSSITLTTASGLGAGFSCIIIQAGTGQVTVAAGTSTTVNSYGALVKTAGQYAMINMFAPVADSFILSGQLA